MTSRFAETAARDIGSIAVARAAVDRTDKASDKRFRVRSIRPLRDRYT